MNITLIPFVQSVGIKQKSEGQLILPFKKELCNHLETMHAAAQFTLAETASGELLQRLFPELKDKVVPLLRSSEIKFKKPSTKELTAFASISDEDVTHFIDQLKRKNRASITVEVNLKDSSSELTCSASFNWFVQAI